MNSQNPLAVYLDRLSDFDWTCADPRPKYKAAGTDGVQYSSFYCEGLLYGVPRAIFLSAHRGRVMLIGETKDASLDEFVQMLKSEQDPAFAMSEPVAVSGRQKSLFGVDSDE